MIDTPPLTTKLYAPPLRPGLVPRPRLVERMHLVITSHTAPPLPLSRLRARSQLTDLRSADLRFTLDKATAFPSQVMRLNLPADDLAVLEGRIAGLRMAAIAVPDKAMRSRPRLLTDV